MIKNFHIGPSDRSSSVLSPAVDGSEGSLRVIAKSHGKDLRWKT